LQNACKAFTIRMQTHDLGLAAACPITRMSLKSR
jgi:hypothetical protein